MDVLEVGDHEVSVLGGLAFQPELVDEAEIGVFRFEADHAVDVVLLDDDVGRQRFEEIQHGRLGGYLVF